MDFDLRDSLLIIGPLFIAAILLHGYWRMRRNSNQIKMSLDRNFMSEPGERLSEDEDIDMLRAELPNGGARVRKIPEQTAFDLDEDVPVLMEPVDEPIRAEPASRAPEEESAQASPSEVSAAEDSDVDSPAGEAPPIGERPEYFIVVYVTALDEPFDGQQLLECLVEHDMQFGEMSIFHRLDADGEPEFSLVNAVEPGTFDMNTIAALKTPAISLFMRAHEQADPVAVYDRMTDVAKALADDLGGEVKDESRSVLTPQTMEHCRERIRDYLMKLG